MNRIRPVARLQIPAWPHILGWTWGLTAVAFGINLLLFLANHDPGDGVRDTGGLVSLYAIAISMATFSVTQIFPYALGMSVTRRDFYLAWSLLALAQSVAYALVLCLLRAVEQATGHWGMGMRYFDLSFMDDANPVLLLLGYAVPMLVVTHFGILLGTVHLRWGTTGVLASLTLTMTALGLAAALITWTRQWHTIGHWLLDQPPTALLAGWPVLVAAAFAGGGYTLIRRATA
ncbi:ABC transporter permease [Streptomyces ferrugineus]|uniref:ABC transporter permease n=1 Tax=Streptomyces ferrugineus TaxID=1413221 RepID=A0A7M2SYV1_9ACTN|nr:ABC transporter permease [Streptomyces ferrugineus]QOV40815.1 ABC transporter permease [Streptomyces ferrugineus]